VQECFRHAKAIGAWGDGREALELAAIPAAPGVVSGDRPTAVFADVHEALATHRVWERFQTVLT
jgi:catalase